MVLTDVCYARFFFFFELIFRLQCSMHGKHIQVNVQQAGKFTDQMIRIHGQNYRHKQDKNVEKLEYF